MVALAGGLLCAPQFAKAQQGERIARVGFLYFGPSLSREEQESWGPFWPTMKDLGWVYGKNIVAERRYGETLEQLHAAAAELAAAAGRAQGVAPHFLVVHDSAELPAAFHEIRKNRNQVLVVVNSPFMWENRKATLDLVFKHRLPAIYDLEQLVVDGGLISYGINVFEIYRRQAFYVDKILRGAKPDDLPIEQATKFELVINAKTAKALGLTIPAALLARANRVIE